MRNVFRRHTLVIFTLFAMLGQVMLSNGFSMVPNAQAHDLSMMMQMSNSDACHPSEVVRQAHCCDAEQNVLPAAQHCCEGNGYCKGDCTHCLVISMTGTLFSVTSWPDFRGSESILATQMPHFHSISLGSELKPPIA